MGVRGKGEDNVDCGEKGLAPEQGVLESACPSAQSLIIAGSARRRRPGRRSRDSTRQPPLLGRKHGRPRSIALRGTGLRSQGICRRSRVGVVAWARALGAGAGPRGGGATRLGGRPPSSRGGSRGRAAAAPRIPGILPLRYRYATRWRPSGSCWRLRPGHHHRSPRAVFPVVTRQAAHGVASPA